MELAKRVLAPPPPPPPPPPPQFPGLAVPTTGRLAHSAGFVRRSSAARPAVLHMPDRLVLAWLVGCSRSPLCESTVGSSVGGTGLVPKYFLSAWPQCRAVLLPHPADCWAATSPPPASQCITPVGCAAHVLPMVFPQQSALRWPASTPLHRHSCRSGCIGQHWAHPTSRPFCIVHRLRGPYRLFPLNYYLSWPATGLIHIFQGPGSAQSDPNLQTRPPRSVRAFSCWSADQPATPRGGALVLGLCSLAGSRHRSLGQNNVPPATKTTNRAKPSPTAILPCQSAFSSGNLTPARPAVRPSLVSVSAHSGIFQCLFSIFPVRPLILLLPLLCTQRLLDLLLVMLSTLWFYRGPGHRASRSFMAREQLARRFASNSACQLQRWGQFLDAPATPGWDLNHPHAGLCARPRWLPGSTREKRPRQASLNRRWCEHALAGRAHVTRLPASPGMCSGNMRRELGMCRCRT